MSIAVIFPGQGSQFVGMGKDLLDEATAAAVLKNADDALGFELTKLMFEGPEEDLKLTKYTQPALLTHSMALWALIKDKIDVKVFAGHSLGEYTALTAAGGLRFEDAVKAVNKRGMFMQEAVPAGVGGMAAVLGADDALVEAVCKEVSTADSVVEPANYNTEGQLVVAGHLSAIERFAPIMKERGAKRVMPLPVSAPFHSTLMAPAQKKMEEFLQGMAIETLTIPVINNVDVAYETAPADIRDSLTRQMTGAVRWTQLVRKLKADGITTYIEVGPGAVLAGLIKKTDKEAQCVNIASLADLSKLS
jgi:[acyl-carrier-protein] S-malonyltransferase